MSKHEPAAKFDYLRYAQVWEDADILNQALGERKGGRLLSIASAGDNVLAMLLLDPSAIDAVDLNPTQLYALELRIAAIKVLDHQQFLQLLGAIDCKNRNVLFGKVAPLLSRQALKFWQQQSMADQLGYANVGKFERYFRLFREKVLPLIHRQTEIESLLAAKDDQQRQSFYEQQWNNRRWRVLFHLFFSRLAMGKLGRDPQFFKHVEGSVADRILKRTEYALTQLQPEHNPYLQTILLGKPASALPLAWRAEHYTTLRARIDRIHPHLNSIEGFLRSQKNTFDGFNLSDIFEYMDSEVYHKNLEVLCSYANPKARLVYWNMLAPRRSPEALHDRLQPLNELAQSLHLQDKAFFYSRLVVEERRG